MIKVLMRPHINDNLSPSGIATVVEKYFKYLPNHGIELVDESADSVDLMACHASALGYKNLPMVSHCHGLYWTGDNPDCAEWEWAENGFVTHNLVAANQITVPSEWVAQTIRRDMHISPHVIPHGIDFGEWDHNEPYEKYILWNKNRGTDACDPKLFDEVSSVLRGQIFISTFGTPSGNVKIIGPKPKDVMANIVKRAGLYLSTAKETFGIGILEAMASGVPVVGIDAGGNKDLIQHGVTGYLAQPNNVDDFVNGILYCIQNRSALGNNAREIAKSFTWDKSIEMVAGVYRLAVKPDQRRVSVIIPCYNKAATVGRAIESVLNQTVKCEIIVVDNNSTDGSTKEISKYLKSGQIRMENPFSISALHCTNQGVAHARNHGISHASGDYIVCLDADDEIEPGYIENCLKAFENESTLGIAYTRIRHINENGDSVITEWPGEFNYDDYHQKNQIPTTCMFRRVGWQSVGGFRQRYAPTGQGSEDADFFLRITSTGRNARMVDSESLFRYYAGGATSNGEYREIDWRGDKGWFTQKAFPFACRATPENSYSHPVMSYDEPQISVIIPVGKGHEKYLIDALDSVEAQAFKRWEVIVVWDNEEYGEDDYDLISRFNHSHPYANFLFGGGNGAGSARNEGSLYAKSPYILFLDADDWLEPTALEKLYQNHHEGIVYSSYYGHAFVDNPDEIANRVVEYDNGIAKILHPAINYDCERAIREPSTGYLWCIISCLIPKSAHEKIGGFDEEMESWEDWDYFIRMAQSGQDFIKIDEPLVNYRFYSGERREVGRQKHEKLIEYMKEKYKGIDMAGCCGGSKRRGILAMPKSQMAMASINNVPDIGNTMRVQLNDGNMGDHPIIGHATKTRYGHKKHGDKFEMDERDIAVAKPGTIIKVQQDLEPEPIVAPPPPVSVFDWTSVKGIGEAKAGQLIRAGIMNPEQFWQASDETLDEIFTESTLKKLKTELESSVPIG